MPKDDKYNNDDYVAKLLAEDAKKSSHRYAAVGLSALLPKRSTTGAPKPNTRFLNHIVREADSHNAALKKKEELEARIRLRELKEREKRTRVEEHDGERERKRRRVNGGEISERHRRRDRSKDRERHRDKARDTSKDRDGARRKRDRSASPRRSHKSRHSEPRSKTSYKYDRRSEGGRSDGKAARRHRNSSSPEHSPKRSSKRHHSSPRPRPAPRRSPSPASVPSDTESDPLDELTGPFPPKKPNHNHDHIHVRGRGAQNTTSKSNIDTHFSSTYDPSQDIHASSPDEPSSEKEDWDMALEALRDRTMWKKKQAERLREAGFGNDEIKKWERSAVVLRNGLADGEDDVRDVRWAKKGEAREWDVGKKGFDNG